MPCVEYHFLLILICLVTSGISQDLGKNYELGFLKQNCRCDVVTTPHQDDDNHTRTKATTIIRALRRQLNHEKTYKNLDLCGRTTLLRKKRWKKGVKR